MPSASLIHSRYFIVLLLAAMAMLLAGMATGCTDNPKAPAVKSGAHKEVPEEGTNIQAYLSEAGLAMGQLESRVKGKLRAPYMLHYQRSDSPYFEFPRTLHVDFYKDSVRVSETPVIESQLDALYGKYLTNQDKVFLRDSVLVKNILKGDTLHCKYLWWDKRTERFTTDDSVRINQPDKTLYGTGMVADQNFRWFTIKKMTGIIRTSGNNLPK